MERRNSPPLPDADILEIDKRNERAIFMKFYGYADPSPVVL